MEPYYAFRYDGPYPVEMFEGDEATGTSVVRWTFDALGRSVSKEVNNPVSGVDLYTWEWDTQWIGARSEVTDPKGTVEYDYLPTLWGGFGAVTHTVRTWTSGEPDTVVEHGYDFAGNVIMTKRPGAVVFSDFSPAGWLLGQTLLWDGPNGKHGATVSHSYDTWGLAKGWTGQETGQVGVKAELTRQTPGRLARLDWEINGDFRSVSWTWSDAGLLLWKRLDNDDDRFRYEYDELKRITGVFDGASPLEGFLYDDAGITTHQGHVRRGVLVYDPPTQFHEVPAAESSSGLREEFTWDPVTGRMLTARELMGGQEVKHTTYGYDGSGRLGTIATTYLEGPTGGTSLHYDVDDTLVQEVRIEPGGVERIYRFSGWRKVVKPKGSPEIIQQVLPQARLENGELRWIMAEPDGHALRVYASDGTGKAFEVAGVFGAPLPTTKGQDFVFGSWPVDGLHGLEGSKVHNVVHAGARHFRMRDGIWLQPEPLLHLGLHQGTPELPLAVGPVYSAGNTNRFADKSGYAFETAWDVVNVGLGVASLASNLAAGNLGGAAVDAVDLAIDGAATVIPGVPGGAGTTIRAARAADKGAGVIAAVAKASKGADVSAAAKGACFVAGTEVVLAGGTVPIEAVREGDRVLASDVPEADTADEAWVEVTPSSKPRPWAGALCERVKRWARTAAVPAALLAACDVAELPAVDEVVQVYDARTGTWSKTLGAELEVGDTFVQAGQVLRVTEDGVEVRGDAALRDLADADRTWVAEAAHRLPGGDDWVLVLGDADEAGHWRLSEVQPGERFAFGGRVFETADADGDGLVEVRATGDVLGEVVDTFVRVAPEVIDAEIVYSDGSTDTLVGTPNHPFWVDAVRDYVPLGELGVGTVLHVQGGGEAILVSKTWRQGDFEVFDFEVLAGPGGSLHNFYVRGEGSDAAGVLVHNSTGKGTATFHKYEGAVGPTGRHVTVEIKDAGGKSLGEFHQTGTKNTAIKQVEPGEIAGTRTKSSGPYDLDDPGGAAEFGNSGWTGKYKDGDCVVGACGVANAGSPSGGQISTGQVRRDLDME